MKQLIGYRGMLSAAVGLALCSVGCATSSHVTVRTYEYDEAPPAEVAPEQEPSSEWQMESPGEMESPGQMTVEPC